MESPSGWYCVQHKVTLKRKLRKHDKCQLKPVSETDTGLVDDGTNKRLKTTEEMKSDDDYQAVRPSTSTSVESTTDTSASKKQNVDDLSNSESQSAAKDYESKQTENNNTDDSDVTSKLEHDINSGSAENLSMEIPDYERSIFIAKSIHTLTVESDLVVGVPTNIILGSAVLPNGQVVLADLNNHRMMLLRKDLCWISKLVLRGDPWDVAVCGDMQVIVSVPTLNRLRYVGITSTGKLQLGGTIPMKMSCYGVAVHCHEIYVCVQGEYSEVRVIDRAGKLLRRIGVDILQLPQYVTVSSKGSVFVSDHDDDHISTMCFDNSGNVLFDFKYDNKNEPRGMLLDQDDNLLVCTSKDNVVLLSNGGTVCKQFLPTANQRDNPYSLAYRNEDDTLILTHWSNNIVCHAYKMKVKFE